MIWVFTKTGYQPSLRAPQANLLLTTLLSDQASHGKQPGPGGPARCDPVTAAQRPPPHARGSRRLCECHRGEPPGGGGHCAAAEAARRYGLVYNGPAGPAAAAARGAWATGSAPPPPGGGRLRSVEGSLASDDSGRRPVSQSPSAQGGRPPPTPLDLAGAGASRRSWWAERLVRDSEALALPPGLHAWLLRQRFSGGRSLSVSVCAPVQLYGRALSHRWIPIYI